jgi:hypothetical protein
MYIISELFICIGVINQATDNHITIFIIFDQTIFHITISVFFFKLAIIDVASSGKLVQIATTVSHIIVSEIQKEDAIDLDALTITSAHKASHIIHQIIKIVDFKVVSL